MTTKEVKKAICPECREELEETIIEDEDRSHLGTVWYACENCHYFFSEPNFKFMDDCIISGKDDDGEYYIRYTDSMKDIFRMNRLKAKAKQEAD